VFFKSSSSQADDEECNIIENMKCWGPSGRNKRIDEISQFLTAYVIGSGISKPRITHGTSRSPNVGLHVRSCVQELMCLQVDIWQEHHHEEEIERIVRERRISIFVVNSEMHTTRSRST